MIRLLQGDCRAVMAGLPADSVDAIVTDPPYHLTAGKKGGTGEASVNLDSPYGRARIGTGFMGMKWDGGDVAFRVETWLEALRVLKPGGHLVAFGGTRTYHRMVCAIEDAGFEIRDQLGWIYGSGFPKSLDVAKAIDSRRDWAALRLLQTKVRAAREALGISQSEAARRMGLIGPGEQLGGGGFMWFETGMRVPTREQYPSLKAALQLGDECDLAFEAAEREVIGHHRPSAPGQNMRAGIGGEGEALPPGVITAPATAAAIAWQGWGTALKPAWEPIVLARKPLAGTVAQNVLEHGTGSLNIDGCRIEPIGAQGFIADDGRGRWPANILHDGSDEVLAAFPYVEGAKAPITGDEPSAKTADLFGDFAARTSSNRVDGGGSAARFFYCAKADKADRHEGLHDPGPQFSAGRMPHDAEQVERQRRGNHHPTVKPTDLMRWLCRLITPPGGTVLDPFMGSGSTLKAAELEGFDAIGIDLDPEYCAIARRRIAADAPLFAEVQAEGVANA